MKTMLKKLHLITKNISNITLLNHIKFGFMISLPFIFIGSIATLFLNFPFEGVTIYLDTLFSGNFNKYMVLIYNGTFRIMSLLITLGIAYSVFSTNKEIIGSNVSPIFPTIIVMGCYFLTTIFEDADVVKDYIGTKGIFYAVIFSLVISNIFLFSFEHRIFVRKFIKQDEDILLFQVLRIIEPATVIFFIVAVFSIIKSNLQLNVMYGEFSSRIFSEIKKNENVFSYSYISTTINNLLWFFGFHGDNVVEQITDGGLRILNNSSPVFVNGKNINLVFSKEFFSTFIYLGGAGSSLSLIFAILSKKRTSLELNVARFSCVMSIFNINELLLYGLPIVMNPYFLLPFIFVPIVLIAVSFLAILFNIIPMATVSSPWTTPILISGYINTGGSIRGAIFQLVNIGIGTLIYMPFVDMYDKYISEESRIAVSKVLLEINKIIKGKNTLLITRKDEVGFLSRSLARDIRSFIYQKKNPMHLEFQPQINKADELIGCEALLRWQHEKYGYISPPLIIAIAEEAELELELGNWIIEEAFKQVILWEKNEISNVKMSINITASQLKSEEFVKNVSSLLIKHNVNPNYIEFELTETQAIEETAEIRNVIKSLKDLGTKIAIDDFGMGHSSLVYIKEFDIDVVKVDGSLVAGIEEDWTAQEIVTSITKLCQSLDIETIAEVVENDKQKNKLSELGCDVFQGFLFSPSLSGEDFEKYYFATTP